MTQQRSRMLAGHTIEQRQLLVRRFARFTGDYPWRWTAGEVEDWTAQLVGAGLTHSTVRNYQTAVALFCSYVSDPRYRWVEVCEQHFGAHPVQVFHEWNTVVHRSEYEGRPGNRPLTREELQAFFDHCDARVAAVSAAGPQGLAGRLPRRGGVQGDLRVGAAPAGGGDAGDGGLVGQPRRG